jgi:non-specific serine/threonine protein kinase/serine/threonine-protein kinase
VPTERESRVKQLLADARARDPHERRAFLEGALAAQPELLSDLEGVLESPLSATSPRDSSRPTSGDPLSPAIVRFGGEPLGRGERIGPYRIVREVGQGGMGVVYEAEQEEPVRRRVALKLVKWGMDTREVLGRFDSERQALALMNHPNIASVYDAGATENGRPYFAMEYVQGLAISEYCDHHRMSLPERLELFIQVCDGVQHAHQKGVIHRDVKPTNVLVSVEDDRAIPKIIDFGVAKAIFQPLTDKTVYTELGQWIGTLEYMSPEQAESTNLDVDTRTDVYSLGVLLYELLVGALPFESKELRRAGFEEFRRKVLQDEPPKPSTRLRALGESSVAPAQNRGLTAAALARELQGDLDRITMKALEKDRTHRYETPSALAHDLQRYLKHEPVRARPPSAGYRLGKFVRRHRAGVAALLTVALALIVGLLLATAGLIRARRAERAAATEAAAAREVADFLEGLFRISAPEQARGKTITARELLDEGAKGISGELADQPLTQARLMDAIGRVYQSLGLYEQARPLLEKSLSLREKTHGPTHPEVARSLQSLADLQAATGVYAEAADLYERALGTWRRAEGRESEVAETLSALASAYRRQGKFKEAEPVYLEALEIRQRLLGEEHVEVADTLRELAILYRERKDFARAEPYFERSLAIRERALGPDHPDVARSLNSLAILYIQQEKFDKAESLLKQSLEVKERTQGPEHPNVANSLDNLAILYARKKQFAEAEPLFRRALAIREKAYGPGHPEVAQVLHNLGNLLSDQARCAEAEPYYRRSLAVSEKILGAGHPNVRDTLQQLAACLRALGRANEADELATRLERVRTGSDL